MLESLNNKNRLSVQKLMMKGPNREGSAQAPFSSPVRSSMHSPSTHVLGPTCLPPPPHIIQVLCPPGGLLWGHRRSPYTSCFTIFFGRCKYSFELLVSSYLDDDILHWVLERLNKVTQDRAGVWTSWALSKSILLVAPTLLPVTAPSNSSPWGRGSVFPFFLYALRVQCSVTGDHMV